MMSFTELRTSLRAVQTTGRAPAHLAAWLLQQALIQPVSVNEEHGYCLTTIGRLVLEDCDSIEASADCVLAFGRSPIRSRYRVH